METAFDTLQAARKLQKAGFEQRQAETLAEVIRQRGGDYATKVDVEKAKNAVLLAILAAVGVILAGVGVLLSVFMPGG